MFQCPLCEHLATRNWSLDNHLGTVHKDHTMFQCDHCDFNTEKHSNLQSHIEKVHETITIQCPHKDCEHQVKTKVGLKMHVKAVHEGAKRFPCPHCDYDGTLEVNLKSHIIQNHSKTFTCSICEYKVAKESILMNHFSQFHGIKIKEGEK